MSLSDTERKLISYLIVSRKLSLGLSFSWSYFWPVSNSSLVLPLSQPMFCQHQVSCRFSGELRNLQKLLLEFPYTHYLTSHLSMSLLSYTAGDTESQRDAYHVIFPRLSPGPRFNPLPLEASLVSRSLRCWDKEAFQR